MKQGELRLRSYAAHGNRTLVIEVESSSAGLIKRLALARILSPFSTASQSGVDGTDFWFADSFKPADPKLSSHIEAAVYGRVVGSNARICCDKDAIEIVLPRSAIEVGTGFVATFLQQSLDQVHKKID